MWFIMGFAGEFVHRGKTHTFWQKGYSVAKVKIIVNCFIKEIYDNI